MINNRFKVEGLLGRGRSSVYLCADSLFPEKQFAAKVLPSKSEEDEVKAFRNEFYLLKKLDHPNIVAAYEHGKVLTLADDDKEIGIRAGDEFIILEYFDGIELSETFAPGEEKLKKIILQMSSVLYYLHQSNYVYYDLKPENILINFDGNNPVLKFIDFGFSRYITLSDEFTARGTKEYMAPEVIKKDPVDHRADIYSFGILLYRMIYKKFPFETENDLQIFKSHISGVFEFPVTDYLMPVDTALKKLLHKNPSDRYYTTVQLLNDLEIDYSSAKKDWNFVPAFSGRTNVVQRLKNYLSGDAGGSIKVITGEEGIGKSEILKHLERNQSNVIRIANSKSNTGADFAVYLINQLIYRDFVFQNLDESLIQYIALHIKPGVKDLIGQVKSIISKISGQLNFSLFIEDIDALDQFAIEILQNLLPILQSNGIHIVVSERSDSKFAVNNFNNSDEINLSPFSSGDLESLIDSSYAAFFPKERLISLIKEFIDPLPGEILKFVSNLIFLKILDFKFDGPEINYSDREKKGLENSFNDIFKNIIADCSFIELQYLKVLAVLKENYPESILNRLVDVNLVESIEIVEQLRNKNILQKTVRSINPEFISIALKEFVYESIKDTKEFHCSIALKLNKIEDENLDSEIAYQFEKCGDFVSSYKYYRKMIEHAEELSALSTQKFLLEKVQAFELPDAEQIEIGTKLTKVLATKGEFKNCLAVSRKTLQMELMNEQRNLLLFMQAFALSNTGELEKAKEILESFLDADYSIGFYFELRLELSRIELKLNGYQKTIKYCSEIVSDPRSTDFYKGQAYNILGLVSIYKEQNPKNALKHFDETLNYYEKANDMVQIAAIEVNIGNIHSMLQDDNEAKKHWNRALQINQSIGNVEQEANILMNTGIFFFKKHNYEKAIENYKRAMNIFLGTGNKFGNGLVYSNLCEAHSQICEFSYALANMSKASKVFSELKASDEHAELLLYKATIYYDLNSSEDLEETIRDISRIAKTNNTHRTQRILEFSKILLNILTGKVNDQRQVHDFILYFLENEDHINASRLIEFRLNSLLNNKEYKKAVKFIENEEIKDIFATKVSEAWKNYLLSTLSEKYPEGTRESQIFYLNNALNLIEDESITNLTVKIIVDLCEYYVKRGNSSKANTYAEYFKSLYQLISQNIPTAALKTSYNGKSEIVNGMNLIKSLNKSQ